METVQPLGLEALPVKPVALGPSVLVRSSYPKSTSPALSNSPLMLASLRPFSFVSSWCSSAECC